MSKLAHEKGLNFLNGNFLNGLKGLQNKIREDTGSPIEYKRTEDIAKAMLDNVVMGISMISPKMEILWINKTLKKWFPHIDVTKKPLCYKSFYLPPRDKICHYCPTIKAFETGRIHSAEVDVCADGKIYNVIATPVRDVEGEISYVVETIEDITTRKQAEKELHHRVEFEKLITNLSTNFINISPDEIDEGINQALKEIGEFAGVDRSYIFLACENKQKVRNTHEWCAKGIEPQIQKLKDLSAKDFPWFTEKIKRLEVIHIPRLCDLPPEARAVKKLLQSQAVKSCICVPMVYGGSAIGFLGFDSVRVEKRWPEENIALLKIAGEMFASALERRHTHKQLIQSNRKLKKLSLKDLSTGLYNHRYLEDAIEVEFYRARRYAHTLSVIMLDLDYFKSVNDVYGHQFGDLVLKQLASLIKKVVRRFDIVIRYGGEEFIIISPTADRSGALNLAKRLLDTINLYNFGNNKHNVKLKLSIAVASYPEDRVFEAMELVKLTEQIVNKAKECGGNRVYSSIDIQEKKQPGSDGGVESSDIIFLRERIEKLTKRSNQSLIEAIFAFAKTIELKDRYTGEHVERTVHYAIEVASVLGLTKEEIEYIRQAAILHDLGKIGISEKILCKRSKLRRTEFAEIKKHPQIGVDIIRPIHFLHSIIPFILYHHERWDGRGYPANLKGEEIPIGARIVAISDVYQALTSERPYRKAFTKEEAVEIIKNGSGTQFDPHIVDAFLKILQQEK